MEQLLNGIIDTHAHYDDEAFTMDRAELLTQLRAQGIKKIVNIGADLASSKATLRLTREYDFIYGAVGVHPSNVRELNEESFSQLVTMSQQDKILMIGEIGLDYYWDKENKEEQREWFRRQLRLAADTGLPASIHSRDAAKDTFDVLKEESDAAILRGKTLRGVLHCYSYGPEMAEQFLALGLFLGIGGVVTFKNSKKLKEVVRDMPSDRILLETDCPYLAPEPHRGKRNASLYLPYVVQTIAMLRDTTEQEILRITEENAERLLGFSS